MPKPVADIELSVSEEDGIRFLHFGSEWVQGAMKIRAPHALVLDYTQDLMVWEGWLDAPTHIVHLGLGAGSTTKYCLQAHPNARVTAVEISSAVYACAVQCFKLPSRHPRLRVAICDAAKWVRDRRNHSSADVLIVDLYDAHARGPVHDSVPFYRDCRRVLRVGGAMTVNVFGDGWGFEDSFAHVLEAFDGAVEALEPCSAGNRVIFARA
jgi:spermidine synthase